MQASPQSLLQRTMALVAKNKKTAQEWSENETARRYGLTDVMD